MCGECSEERGKLLGTFTEVIRTGGDAMGVCIHHGVDPCSLLQVCAIADEMVNGRKIMRVRRRLCEPVPENAADCRATVFTLPRKLPNGIAMDDPSLEPDELPRFLGTHKVPFKSPMTALASPTLFMISTCAIAFSIG